LFSNITIQAQGIIGIVHFCTHPFSSERNNSFYCFNSNHQQRKIDASHAESDHNLQGKQDSVEPRTYLLEPGV